MSCYATVIIHLTHNQINNLPLHSSGIAAGGNCPPPKKIFFLICRKIFFLSDNFSPKIKNLGLKIAYFGGFKGNIKIFKHL